jgi:hypothetical protein
MTLSVAQTMCCQKVEWNVCRNIEESSTINAAHPRKPKLQIKLQPGEKKHKKLPSNYVLSFLWETKFHTRTKQQVKLY